MTSKERRLEPIDLCCLDLAGTTVADDGVVDAAFIDALGSVGISESSPSWPDVLSVVTSTMGTSKIEVFRSLLFDEERALLANRAFETAYAARVANGAVTPIEGAAEAIEAMRTAGIHVAFNTGFSPTTRDTLLEALGWEDLADLALSPDDVGRGRPAPDLVLASIIALGTTGVGSTAVCGDTPADIECGRRAGAAIVAGVLTGTGQRADLAEAGATHILGSVAELPALVAAVHAAHP
jgi:phosphoglycolate phosphatase